VENHFVDFTGMVDVGKRARRPVLLYLVARGWWLVNEKSAKTRSRPWYKGVGKLAKARFENLCDYDNGKSFILISQSGEISEPNRDEKLAGRREVGGCYRIHRRQNTGEKKPSPQGPAADSRQQLEAS
jgi:hypothetical protein